MTYVLLAVNKIINSITTLSRGDLSTGIIIERYPIMIPKIWWDKLVENVTDYTEFDDALSAFQEKWDMAQFLERFVCFPSCF